MTPELLDIRNMGEELACLARLDEPRLPGELSAVSVVRITDGAKAHLAASIPGKRIYVAPDPPAARSMFSKISSFPGVRAVFLSHRDDVLMCRNAYSLRGAAERGAALGRAACGDADIVVVCADALLQKYPRAETIAEYSVHFAVEDVISPQDAADRLARAGYSRREMVADPGEFALRGDILDVVTSEGAYRINFFDELVESVKSIDLSSMLSVDDLGEVRIYPASDTVFSKEDAEEVKSALSSHAVNPVASSLESRVTWGAAPAELAWAQVFSSGSSFLFDCFGADARPVVIFDEPKIIADKFEVLTKEFRGRIDPLVTAGEILPEHADALYAPSEVRRRIMLARKVSFTSLELGNPLFAPTKLLTPKTRPVTKYYLAPDSVGQDLKNFVLSGFRVLVCTGSPERAKSVRESLAEQDVGTEYSVDGEGSASVRVTPLSIETGFVYPAEKVAVIGVSECVGKRRGASIALPKTQFTAPKAGDYVVHRVHGIGLCEGTTIMKAGEFEKEYVILRYRDGDVLYVATDQMDNLQKFVGEENPRLNKIGGKEFAREKDKVKKSVRKLAVDLLRLYAEREKKKGHVYAPDTVWQKEFEDEFEYEETADQLKAIEAVKQDMEQGKIMDRLLVGDVGFGKTEVAFRAMFKTVMDGKQAVLVAPTTILARQHHENLTKRLEPFGIECALLTRLQTSSENAETVRRLADGTLYMAIATHKVLSKGVEFKDLGLLVLDEEQRFGVEHKELLKARNPLVNVLTLSATPIPRTLNMALSGVRDISLLETAPRGRLPVQTYVIPYSDALVADAVTRECARGGQTLILLNDIDALEGFGAKLSSMLPAGTGIVTAHGQMTGGELEKRIAAFYEKKYDVLIATTIIENGIDLPDANTLIVVDSGRFGLSQLYQLRGRVGRRGVLAHAYFTVPENGVLTSDAEKRLRALMENTEIGSGFRIALSDLSIRGAGTLLGAEQHGHIERVGYEMYIELLNEAVEEMRTGRKTEEIREVEMKVDVPAFIRDGYVSGRDKLRFYKRIATVSTAAERNAVLSELSEVYGAPDDALVNLVDVALLKNLARGFGAARVILNRNGAGVVFADAGVFGDETLMKAVAAHRTDAVLTSAIPPSLIFDVKGLSNTDKLAKLISFFEEAVSGTEAA